MFFLLKFVVSVTMFSGVLLGGVIAYRETTDPLLYRLLQVNEDCSQQCWFGVPPDGSVIRRDIIERVDNSDTAIRLANSRNSNIIFALEEYPGGTFTVQLRDGYGVTHCYFPQPNTVTIGDVHAAFGEPDYLWVDYDESVPFFPVKQPYQMRLADEHIFVEGDLTRPDIRDFRTATGIFITSICTSDDLSLLQPDREPNTNAVWLGYEVIVRLYDPPPPIMEPMFE